MMQCNNYVVSSLTRGRENLSNHQARQTSNVVATLHLTMRFQSAVAGVQTSLPRRTPRLFDANRHSGAGRQTDINPQTPIHRQTDTNTSCNREDSLPTADP